MSPPTFLLKNHQIQAMQQIYGNKFPQMSLVLAIIFTLSCMFLIGRFSTRGLMIFPEADRNTVQRKGWGFMQVITIDYCRLVAVGMCLLCGRPRANPDGYQVATPTVGCSPSRQHFTLDESKEDSDGM